MASIQVSCSRLSTERIKIQASGFRTFLRDFELYNAFGFSYHIAYTAIVSLIRESLFPEVGE
jgi:hypothetical protein